MNKQNGNRSTDTEQAVGHQRGDGRVTGIKNNLDQHVSHFIRVLRSGYFSQGHRARQGVCWERRASWALGTVSGYFPEGTRESATHYQKLQRT